VVVVSHEEMHWHGTIKALVAVLVDDRVLAETTTKAKAMTQWTVSNIRTIRRVRAGLAKAKC